MDNPKDMQERAAGAAFPHACTSIPPFSDVRCGAPATWEWTPPPRLSHLRDAWGMKEARYCDACHKLRGDRFPEWTKRRIGPPETRECEGCGQQKPIEEMSTVFLPGTGETYQCEKCRGSK